MIKDKLQFFLPLDVLDFPQKVTVTKIFTMDSQTYSKVNDAYLQITMLDDDFTVGNCTCSNCNKRVDIFDKYCKHCGSKFKERKEIDET